MKLRNTRPGVIATTKIVPRPKGERFAGIGQRVLLRTGDVGDFDPAKVWTQRKALAGQLVPVDRAGEKWLDDLRKE